MAITPEFAEWYNQQFGADYTAEDLKERLDKAAEEYGTIPAGERAYRASELPLSKSVPARSALVGESGISQGTGPAQPRMNVHYNYDWVGIFKQEIAEIEPQLDALRAERGHILELLRNARDDSAESGDPKTAELIDNSWNRMAARLAEIEVLIEDLDTKLRKAQDNLAWFLSPRLQKSSDSSAGSGTTPSPDKPKPKSSVLLGFLGAILAFIAWFFAYQLTGFCVALLASVPLLGAILWWPSDSGIAFTVLPASAAVMIGGLTANLIGRVLAKRIFALCILLLYGANTLYILIFGPFTWGELGVCVVSIVGAVILLTDKE